MKITKETLRRGLRTFLQAFIGSLITCGCAIEWTDISIKNAFIGVIITSLFAGLSAISMNMENSKE